MDIFVWLAVSSKPSRSKPIVT